MDCHDLRHWFGPVVTTKAHLALFWCPNTSSIFYNTVHAAGICLGTIQDRTHVQLALACQQCMIRVQHRLRFTMQHVFGHSGNWGNECADHAAALGTLWAYLEPQCHLAMGSAHLRL